MAPLSSQDREDLDNQLEDYFFALALSKTSMLEALGDLAGAFMLDPQTGFALTWLTDEDKTALRRVVFGTASEDIRTRVKREILDDMEHIRTKSIHELGGIFSLLLRVTESIINVPDGDSLRFIMNQKKEEVEMALLTLFRRIITEYAETIRTGLREHRDMIERNPETTFHEVEIGRITRQLYETTDRLIESYSTEPEIEGMIEGFLRQNTMFTKRF